MSYLPKPQQNQDSQRRPHKPRGLCTMHRTGTVLAQTVKLVLLSSHESETRAFKGIY